jgi:hypothetical protein
MEREVMDRQHQQQIDERYMVKTDLPRKTRMIIDEDGASHIATHEAVMSRPPLDFF